MGDLEISDRLQYAATGSLLSFVANVFLPSIFLCVDYFDLLPAYRIHHGIPMQRRMTLLHGFLGQCMATVVGFFFFYYGLYHVDLWLNPELFSAPTPSVVASCLHVFSAFIILDFLGYWLHRWFHSQWLFKFSHFKHHEFHSPNGFAAAHVHWLEGSIALVTLVTCSSAVFKMPFQTRALFYAYQLLNQTYCHLGYEFPLCQLVVGNVAREHVYHHTHNKGCYGIYSGFWDRMYGTNNHFLEYMAARKPDHPPPDI